MEIVYKRLEELKHYENNPRFNDEATKYESEATLNTLVKIISKDIIFYK